MQDNNFDFNNQTPPENNNRPDYSYNWNGSEYNNNNKGKRGKTILAVLLVLAVLAITALGVYNSQPPANTQSDSSAESSTSQENSKDPLEYSRDPDASVPEFNLSPDTNVDLSTDLTKVYQKCAPSCCTVSVSYRGKPYSIGSGFVIDTENGYIATNHHVIENGDAIKVIFYDGKEYDAQLVGSDPVTDLAVLYVEAKDLPQVSFGDSKSLSIGQNVVAIGTPYDETLAGTMTYGIISGIARDIEITNDSGKVVKTMTLIQTDCAINPGNSGGPLIDMSGNVIGINSLKIASDLYENIGFAIPITSAIDVFKKLIAGESVGDSDIAIATPQIGITVYDVEDGLEYFRIKPRCEYPEGVLISDIDINSSAYAAGLSRYDIITDFNGYEIKTREDIANALSKFKAGDKVSVTVFRFNRMLTSGETVVIEFKLDAAT